VVEFFYRTNSTRRGQKTYVPFVKRSGWRKMARIRNLGTLDIDLTPPMGEFGLKLRVDTLPSDFQTIRGSCVWIRTDGRILATSLCFDPEVSAEYRAHEVAQTTRLIQTLYCLGLIPVLANLARTEKADWDGICVRAQEWGYELSWKKKETILNSVNYVRSLAGKMSRWYAR